MLNLFCRCYVNGRASYTLSTDDWNKAADWMGRTWKDAHTKAVGMGSNRIVDISFTIQDRNA